MAQEMKAILALIFAVFSASAQDFDFAQYASAQQAAATTENTLTNGIIAYWAMEGLGVDFTNSVSTNYTLTETLDVLDGEGKVGRASVWDGVSFDYLSTADSDVWSVGPGSLTVAFWCYPGKTNAQQYYVKKDSLSAGGREWNVRIDATDGKFASNYYTNLTTAAGGPIVGGLTPLNAWTFVCVKFDSTNMVNSIRTGNSTTLGAWVTGGVNWINTTNGTATLTFGSASVATLQGRLDEVGIWSRVLSDSEITNLWNSGSGKTWPLSP